MWRPVGLPHLLRRRPAAALVLAFWAGVAAGGCASGPGAGPESAPVSAPVEVVHPDQGHDHIPLPAFPHAPYVSYPPASGPHTPYTARWGIHVKPVPDEVLVHNLEHGGVVLAYRCTDCPEVAAALVELAAGYPLVVIAPNPRLPAPVVLSAWRHTLRVQALDDEGKWAVSRFLARHHGIDHHPRGHRHAAPSAPPAPGSGPAR